MEEELQNFPKLVKYFEKYGEIGEPDSRRQNLQLDQLEKFINQQKTKLEKSAENIKNKTYPDPSIFYGKHRMVLSVLIEYSKEIHEKLKETEDDYYGELIILLNQIAFAISDNPKLIIDVDKLTHFLISKIANDETFKKYRNMRRSINAKMKYIVSSKLKQNYASMLSIEFIQANQRFEKNVLYSPPSHFDVVFCEYIRNSPKLSKMVPAAALTIVNTDIETANFTINQLALEVYKTLNLDEKGYSRNIVYTSLIRMLFDEAYNQDSELCKYNDANALFLIKCDDFSKQRVKDLGLSEYIVKNYTPGLGIQSLFKSKQVNLLKQMELMTNPIDLMKHVHTILISLTKYFGGGKTMSFDDTFILLLALISLSPPVNAVSIAKFVNKWDCVHLSNTVSLSKKYYIAAVKHLISFDEEETEEEEYWEEEEKDT